MTARRLASPIVVAALMMLCCGILDAQRSPSRAAAATPEPMTAERFLERARAGTQRYRKTQDAAIADGYKPVGVEFPAMGVHWVHLGRVLEDSLIPERPSILIYVTIDGEPRLAGVAYSDLLRDGESPPSFLAAGHWHEHNGTVADESFPLTHQSMLGSAVSSERSASDMRLAVLHAWLWLPNPAGVFVTDNWSLPGARLGLSVPDATPRDALHALALATDEDGYLLLTLRTGLGLSPNEETAVSQVLARQRMLAMREASAAHRTRRFAPGQANRLATLWSATWTELERALPRKAQQLRALRRQLT